MRVRYGIISFLKWVAMSLRVIVNVLRHWPIIVLAFAVMSPVGPHIRMEYRYDRDGDNYVMHCRYFGSRGFREVSASECPLISPLMDSRN